MRWYLSTLSTSDSHCVREFQSLAELLLFQSSFKLEARMMAEMIAQ